MLSRYLPKMLICWFALISVVFLPACSGQEEVDNDLTESVAKIKQKSLEKAKKIQIETPKLPANVKFNAPGIKAPFEKKTKSPLDVKNINVSPLLAYPVTMLKLVGTIDDGSVTFAYVLAPDQVVYRVDQGDILGDKQGRVVSITPDRVEVMVLDEADGEAPVQRKIVLELKDEH